MPGILSMRERSNEKLKSKGRTEREIQYGSKVKASSVLQNISKGMSSLWKVKLLSRVRLFATPRTVAYHAPPSIGFSRQECWNGLPFPSPEDISDPVIEPGSPRLQADVLPSEPPGKSFGRGVLISFIHKLAGTNYLYMS